MAKQPKKPILKDKQGVRHISTTQVASEPKPKGVVPDFKQNQARVEARHQEQLAANEKARKAADAAKELKLQQAWESKQEKLRASYAQFVAGTEADDYLIGVDQFPFVIYRRPFSAKGNLPAQMVLVIEEYQARHGTKLPVYIPHDFLFMNVKKVPFAGGAVGEVQKKMFLLLKSTLAKEIATEKAFRENPPSKGDHSIVTMTKVDEEHSIALNDAGPVDNAAASIAGVDHEHELLELETA